MSGIDEILAGYENLRPGQEDFYRDLHQHPELSHQEHQTARRVAERLRGDGFTVQEGIGGTGVTGVLANGSGPTVLLRCELDALPLRETTGAPFASTVTVKDAQGQEVPARARRRWSTTACSRASPSRTSRWPSTCCTSSPATPSSSSTCAAIPP